jgi:hypothetical protein
LAENFGARRWKTLSLGKQNSWVRRYSCSDENHSDKISEFPLGAGRMPWDEFAQINLVSTPEIATEKNVEMKGTLEKK